MQEILPNDVRQIVLNDHVKRHQLTFSRKKIDSPLAAALFQQIASSHEPYHCGTYSLQGMITTGLQKPENSNPNLIF